MNKIINALLITLLLFCSFTSVYADNKFLFDYKVTNIDNQISDLSAYKGKVVLVVNTASNCGFTYQYEGLEKIYNKYKEQGFVVLAFPSNDFGEQEPGDNKEIKYFCENKYNVTFPVFAKGPVSGPEKQEVYKFLTEMSDPKFNGDPGWNFVKFLVNKDGSVVNRFSSSTKPESETITSEIERLLKE